MSKAFPERCIVDYSPSWSEYSDAFPQRAIFKSDQLFRKGRVSQGRWIMGSILGGTIGGTFGL